LDALAEEAIVGSIAGDDTIFIVVHSNEEAFEFTNYIREIIGL
jgi:arginine repressor